MSQIRKLAGQTAVYGMGTIIPRIIYFALLTPFYLRFFEKGEYGVITELYAYVVIINVVITFGMETGFFRFSQDRKRFNSVFTMATGVVTSLALLFLFIVLAFKNTIASWILYEDYTNYLVWFAIIIVLDSISAIAFAKLRRENRAKHFTILKIVNIVLTVGLVFFFLKWWPLWCSSSPDLWINQYYNPELKVGYVFVANLIASTIIFLLIVPEFRSLRWRWDKELLIQILRFSAPLVVVGIAGSINEVADKILLKFLYPEQEFASGEVGVYGAVTRMAVIMTLFIQMFRYAFEPFLFAQRDKTNGKLYAQIMDVFIAFGVFIFLMTGFFDDVLAKKFFFTSNYNDYAEGLKVLPLILLANLFLGIYYSLSVWYKITDLTRYAAVMALGGSAITLIMNAILIPKYSYIGSAWAHLACYTFMMICSYLWGRKVNPIPYDVKNNLVMILLGLTLYIGGKVYMRTIGEGYYIVIAIMLIFFVLYANRKLNLVKLFLSKEYENES